MAQPTHALHPVYLRGAAAPGSYPPGPTPPLIVERIEQDFVNALLNDLKADQTLAAVLAKQAKTLDAGGVLKLLQPVHRTFEVVLVEAVCDPVGQAALQPRLDPQRIESAGLVVRRQGVDRNGNLLAGVFEGWRRQGAAFQGWVPFGDEAEATVDADPQRRPPAFSAGHPEVNRLLRKKGGLPLPANSTLAESVSPLFVAPPEVCAAAGKTLLYGLLPVTSSEVSEAPPAVAAADLKPEDVGAALPAFLRAGGPSAVPWAGQTIGAAQADSPVLDAETAQAIAEFLDLLRLLAIDLNVFGTAAGVASGRSVSSQALLDELNGIDLNFHFQFLEGIEGIGGFLDIGSIGDDAPPWPAGDFLRQAASVLVERQGGTVGMPVWWPAIDAEQAGRIAQLVTAALRDRLQAVAAAGEGRFDGQGRRYHARAFIRVKHAPDCPPETVWSLPSAPFTIAPWYDSGNAPPVRIALPDATNRDFLKALKPNVTFELPKSLEDLLAKNSPKSFLDGKAGQPAGGGLALGWICSFSIPIITLCAFIVLNIFLQLFDLIFHWMLFIKICIPFPRRA